MKRIVEQGNGRLANVNLLRRRRVGVSLKKDSQMLGI